MKPITARSLLFSFLLLNIATGTVAGAMQLVVPLYAMKLQASAAEIGVIRGISGIGMLLLVIPAGFLVDHFGSRRLFLAGGLAGACLTYGLSWAARPSDIAWLLGLTGLFAALKMTALNAAFFSRLADMGLSRAGWFKGSMSIGLTFIGPLLGGFLDLQLAPGQSFQVLAWMTLLPCALVYFFHADAPGARSTGGLVDSLRAQLHDFRQLLGQRTLYLPLLIEGVSTGCFATFSAFIVVVVVQTLKLPATAASVLLTVEGGVFILTVFLAGGLITRLRPARLYLLSIGSTVLALVGLAFAQGYAAVVAFSGLLGLGLGFCNLVTSARIGQFSGNKGKIVSVFAAAVGAGISVGPMLGGVVGSFFGVAAIFLAFVPLFLLLAAACIAQERWQARQAGGPSAAPDGRPPAAALDSAGP